MTGHVNIHAHWDGRNVDQGLERLQNDMGRFRDSSQRVNRVVGNIGPALVAAFSGVGAIALGERILDMARLADQMEITTDAFDAQARRWGSTGPQELEKLRTAVGETLSDLDLMARVGAGVDAGLQFQQSRIAVEYLRRYSLAFQKDFNQLTQTIFTGLSRGSVLMLDDAGIIIDASSEIFDGLSDVEKKAALVGEAIRLMNEKMDRLPEIESNIITETDRLAVSLENLNVELGRAVEKEVNIAVSLVGDSLNLFTDYIEGQVATRDRIQRERQLVREGENVPGVSWVERLNIQAEAAFERFLTRTYRGIVETFDALGTSREEALYGPYVNRPSVPLRPTAPDVPYGFFETGERPSVEHPIELVFPPDTPEDVQKKFGLFDIPLKPIEVDARLAEEAAQNIRRSLEQQSFGDGSYVGTGYQGRWTNIAAQYQRDRYYGPGGNQGSPANDRSIGDRLRDELGRSVDDLDLFADALSRLHPELGTLVGTVNVGVQSLDVFTSATSLLGKAAGAIGVGGALFSLADSIFGWSRDAQERAQRNAELAREQARAQQELNREIEDAISLTGRFANEISGQTDQELRNAFSRNVSILGQYLNTAGLSIENALSRENDLRLQLERKNFDERFDFLELALNQNITTAKTYHQRIIDAELDLRREQGEIIIDAIERQRRDVLQAQENALEAVRQAEIRAVGLRFDFLEADLRARYLPRFQATQSGVGREVLLGQVSRDIETLRRGESAALEQALNALIEPSNERVDMVNTYYDGLVQAVRDAIPDTSQPLISAIEEQTRAFLEAFRAGEVSDPLADLPQDLREFTTAFLEGAEAEILARAEQIDLAVTLPPIDLPPIAPSAEEVTIGEGGVSIDIPPLAPDPTEITASIIHINFPEIPDDKIGDNFTLATIHFNFPELTPGTEDIAAYQLNFNFPVLNPAVGGGNQDIAAYQLNFNFPVLNPAVGGGNQDIAAYQLNFNFPVLNPAVGGGNQDIAAYQLNFNFPVLNPAVGGGNQDIAAYQLNFNFPVLNPAVGGGNQDIAAYQLNFNFPVLNPAVGGGNQDIAAYQLNFNFLTFNPTVGGDNERIAPYTVALNFPLLHPGIDQIQVGGVDVSLPHLALEWPPLPRWVWPPLPKLEISVSGNITTTQRVVHAPPPPTRNTYNPADFNTPGGTFVDDGDFETEEEEQAADPGAVLGDGVQAGIVSSLDGNTALNRAFRDAFNRASRG